MKSVGRRSLIGVWAACLILTATAYAGIIGPEKRALATLKAQARALYDKGNENEEVIAEEPRIQDARRRIHDEVLALAGATGTSSTRTFLEDIDRESSRWQTRIISLNQAPRELAGPAQEPLTSRDTTIELRGGFASVIGMLQGFSSTSTLIEVSRISLAVSGDADESASAPSIDATIDARVYTLASGWEEKTTNAPSRTTRRRP